MTDHDSFMRAIIADPGNDAPRLIYSDWLEETGKEENVVLAEFIRVQIELAKWFDPHEHAARAGPLRERERELLPRIGVPAAVRALERFGGDWQFRRGCVEIIRCSWRSLCEHGEPITRATPLQHAHLTDAPGYGDPEPIRPFAENADERTFKDTRWPGVTIHLPRQTDWDALPESETLTDGLAIEQAVGAIVRDGFTLRLQPPTAPAR